MRKSTLSRERVHIFEITLCTNTNVPNSRTSPLAFPCSSFDLLLMLFIGQSLWTRALPLSKCPFLPSFFHAFHSLPKGPPLRLCVWMRTRVHYKDNKRRARPYERAKKKGKQWVMYRFAEAKDMRRPFFCL